MAHLYDIDGCIFEIKWGGATYIVRASGVSKYESIDAHEFWIPEHNDNVLYIGGCFPLAHIDSLKILHRPN